MRSHDFPTSVDPLPPRPTTRRQPEIEDRGEIVRLTLKLQIKKIDGRRLLLAPEGDDLVIPSTPEPKQHIVDAIGLAYRWHDELVSTGQTVATLARRTELDETRIHRLLPLTYLGPNILKAILTGSHPPRLTLNDLLRAAKQLDWAAQQRHLGITPSY